MRSLLFVPADSEKKLANAMTSGADALIVDLEDSVAGGAKGKARGMAAAFLADACKSVVHPRLYVRINALDTPLWDDDLAAVVGAAPDGVMQPKPSSGEDVHRLSIALDHAEARVGRAIGATRIIAIATEVPASLLAMHTYIGASARLEVLTWGAEDLSAVLGSQSTREAAGGTWTSPYRLARDLTLFTAVAAGAQPIDTVFVDFRDVAGLEAEARLSARDGFTGKLAIHPDQVGPINRAFTPDHDQIAWARSVMKLFADNPGAGALALDGQMIDRPHLVRAERVIARAKLAGLA